MHHKRKGPKTPARAGCLMCKPHKRCGCHKDTHADAKRTVDTIIKDLLDFKDENGKRMFVERGEVKAK